MPAVAVGMIPGLVAWTTLMTKTSWRAAGYGSTVGLDLSPALVDAAHANNLFVDGGFALEQGFIYSAMILAAMTVHILKRQFAKAAVWSFSAAVLSTLGVMHSWQFTRGDTVVYIPLLEQLSAHRAPKTLAELVPAWEYAVAYGIVSVLLLAAPWVTTPAEGS